MVSPSPAIGAEIHEAQPQRPASDAGIKVGDVVLGYRAEAEGAGAGPIEGAADLRALEMRWGDLGPITLVGRSGDTPREWRLLSNGWGVKPRPVTQGEQRARLLAALAALEQGEVDAACPQLAALAQEWSAAGRRSDALWADWRCLDERIRKKQPAEVAAGIARLWPVRDPRYRIVLGLAAVNLAGSAYDVTDWKLLEALLRHAETAFAGSDPRLATLAALRRGKATVVRGQFAEVLTVLEPSAALLRQSAPGSLRLAAVQNEMAWANFNLDRLAEAERLLRDTLAISAERSLNGVDYSKYQGHLAMVLRARGDLDGAEREMEAALQRLVAMQAGDKFIAPVWNNLGVIRRDRGDYVGAEDAFRQTMEMEERRAPEFVMVAIAYGNMASIARARGDLDATQRWAERARPILLKAVPDGTEVGQNLHLLGSIALDRGRLDEARQWFERAIEVWQRIAPRTQRHALSVEHLGLIAQRRGQPDEARRLFASALDMRRAAAPDGLEEALSWYRIGSLELEQERYPEARTALEKAVRIAARLSPEAINHANALNALGRTELAQGETDRARGTLCRASAVLDKLRARLSRDPREQAEAIAQHARIRQDCIAAEAAAGNATAAFDTLERGRGRALLAMLAQRDLTFAEDLPAQLRREWAALEADLDRVRNKRSAVAASTDVAARAELEEQARALGSRRGRLIDRIRKEAPRFAALQFPEPITYGTLSDRLDQDTALVAIMVGSTDAYAFVARRGESQPRLRRLEIDRSTLRSELADFRSALVSKGASSARVEREARRWHARLIEPIAADLQGATRLVLVPDAELFALPYAVLMDAQGHFLLERYSVSVADSATLWAAAPARAGSSSRTRDAELVAVANGEPSPGGSALPSMRGAATLPALPYARVEVERIAALARGKSTVLADAQATETRVEQLARDAGGLHFAVHSLFDPVSPLESGLVLRADAARRDSSADGLLQVWEIFEGWRTPASLVTLSGCETGQGAALADEGLVGLTRAFQFAGARNVVASLWSVSDRSTSELMTRFYRELARGVPVDLALRAAQVSMLRDPLEGKVTDADRGVGGLVPVAPATDRAAQDWTWAAFQVYGS